MLPEVSSTRSIEVALASTPVPLSRIGTVGLVGSLLLIVSVAENGPVVVGAKTTTNRALPPPGMVTGPSEVVEGSVVGSLLAMVSVAFDETTAAGVNLTVTESEPPGAMLLAPDGPALNGAGAVI